MKNTTRILVCLALLGVTPVFGAGPAKGGKAPAKQAPALPSNTLHQLIDQTLPHINSIAGPNKVQERTRLVEAQATFTASATTATPAEQPMYQAAAAAVATLIAAVDEHDKTVADFRFSKSVHGPQDTKDARVTNAVGNSWADNAKERKENADSRKALLAKEQFMNKAVIETWTVRTGQLRAGVEQAYERELVIEKQLLAARTTQVAAVTPPAPPKAPAPKPKEPSAAQEYSPVGTWKGERGGLDLTLKEDNTATRGSLKGTWKWTNQGKGELHIDWNSGVSADVTFSKDGRGLSGQNSKGTGIKFSRAD